MKSVVVIAALVGMLSPVVLGATVVDDHFDDGAIGTNITGIGSGFNSGTWSGGAAVTESGTTVTLENSEVAWARASITSKDGAAMSSAASFQFKGVRFSQSPNGWDWGGTTDRLALGVKANDMAQEFDAGLWQGFYVQFESDSLVTGSNSQFNGISTLFYVDGSQNTTTLATWTFDTLNWDDWTDFAATADFTPVLDMTLDLDTDGYSLTIAGDTISLLSGSLSGTFAAAGITNGLTAGHAFIYAQTENPSLFTAVDQIVITGTAVPEPATLVLLGLGGVLLRRKK